MRVVAGVVRGRRLVAPSGSTVRPTTDRVKESIFNALGSLDLLRDAQVVDLFAGSGALGIEALSRGASHVTFVDNDRASIAVVRQNLAAVGLEAQATIRQADAFAALATGVATDALVVLADPPYQFDRWDELFAAIAAPWVVIEAGAPVVLPAGWINVRERAYGSTIVCFAHRDAPSAA